MPETDKEPMLTMARHDGALTRDLLIETAQQVDIDAWARREARNRT